WGWKAIFTPHVFLMFQVIENPVLSNRRRAGARRAACNETTAMAVSYKWSSWRDNREIRLRRLKQREEIQQRKATAIHVDLIGKSQILETGLLGEEFEQEVTGQVDGGVGVRILRFLVVVQHPVHDGQDIVLFHVREMEVDRQLF